MDRDIEKDLLEIECVIREHEERDNTFTVSVLQRCHELVSELKKNRDLEEQGLLLKLQCKVGDKVYVFEERKHYTVMQVNKIEIKHTLYGDICYIFEPVGRRGCLYRYLKDDFGKTVFLTQPEAEKALKRMEDNYAGSI